MPPHTVPSTIVQLAAPAGGWPQVPRLAPDAMLQMPPQQSDAAVHTSPFCAQYEAGAHTLFLQSVEQQSLSVV
jgi:hypothetical protein